MPIDIKKLREATKTDLVVNGENSVKWNDNEGANLYDIELRKKSENTYQKIAMEIVNVSGSQLNIQNESKNKLKRIFTFFFMFFIGVQLVVLFALLFIKAFVVSITLSDTLVLAIYCYGFR